MQQNNEVQQNGCFKEAVCVDAQRVYDSCSSKDCLEDLQVFFATSKRPTIEHCASVRLRSVDVITTYVNMEPVPFNKGFYSVDMTFVFDVCVDVYTAPASCPVSVNGLSLFTKKAILYGSDGNVKLFTSGHPCDDSVPPENGKVLPKAVVQVADPVGLSARVCDARPGCNCGCQVPEEISKQFGGDFDSECARNIYITIGLFSIVQIVRNVQMLIPAYDFCFPAKECANSSSDDPCEMFKKIDFPTDEFFPPKASECGCNKDSN